MIQPNEYIAREQQFACESNFSSYRNALCVVVACERLDIRDIVVYSAKCLSEWDLPKAAGSKDSLP
jgi:hypothetical protein